MYWFQRYKGIVNIGLFKEESVPKHSVGNMDNICCKCAALMFNGECKKPTSGGRAFSLWCSKVKFQFYPFLNLQFSCKNSYDILLQGHDIFYNIFGLTILA